MIMIDFFGYIQVLNKLRVARFPSVKPCCWIC